MKFIFCIILLVITLFVVFRFFIYMESTNRKPRRVVSGFNVVMVYVEGIAALILVSGDCDEIYSINGDDVSELDLENFIAEAKIKGKKVDSHLMYSAEIITEYFGERFTLDGHGIVLDYARLLK